MSFEDFSLTTFIQESNKIDPQPDSNSKNGIVAGQKDGDLLFDNQVSAYRLIVSIVQERNLTCNDLLDTHRELTRNVKFFEQNNTSGKIRTCNINIPKVVVFPDHFHIKDLLDYVWYPFYLKGIDNLVNKSVEERSIIAYQIHDLFECIHPFLDGNGRVGRLLLNAVRLQLGLEPIVIYFDDRFKYYAKIEAFRKNIFEEIYSDFKNMTHIADPIKRAYKLALEAQRPSG